MSPRRRTQPARTRGPMKVTRFEPGSPDEIISVEHVTPPKAADARATIHDGHARGTRPPRDG